MTPRERFYAMATHQSTDRAVFDLCGSPQTFVDYQTTKDQLAALLGITGEKQGNFCIDERILRALNIDTRLIGGMPTPASAHKRAEGGVSYDSWGIGYRPIDGHMEICMNPLRDCTIDEMMAFELPDPERVDRRQIRCWAEEAEALQKGSDCAVIAEHPVLGVFELGCWMFGFDDFLYRMAAEPEMVHAFFQRIWAYQKRVIEIYYGTLGAFIDCTTSGDDFGTQTGPFISTAMFDETIKPYLQARIQHTRKHTGAFYKHHTCGSVFNLIPSLIDCGVDILNPIQPGVYAMDPEQLKAAYGNRIAFWGGVDTQRLLPNASVEEIKCEVGRLLSILDQNGGYVLSPAHTIQYDVPAENLLAVYQGAREYYGL